MAVRPRYTQGRAIAALFYLIDYWILKLRSIVTTRGTIHDDHFGFPILCPMVSIASVRGIRSRLLFGNADELALCLDEIGFGPFLLP